MYLGGSRCADGEVDLVDLSGVLSRQRGVEFVTVVPQLPFKM